MKTILFDSKGNKSGNVELPENMVSEQINSTTLAQVVRTHLINARQGTKNVKTRSEVRGKAKKPYKQKGTGNARQGSRKGPHYKGGGVAHAPKMMFYNSTVMNKVNKKAINMAWKKQAQSNRVFVFEKPELADSKLTKQLQDFIDNTKLTGNILFALKQSDPKLLKAAKNINNIEIADMNSVDVYRILKSSYILVQK